MKVTKDRPKRKRNRPDVILTLAPRLPVYLESLDRLRRRKITFAGNNPSLGVAKRLSRLLFH